MILLIRDTEQKKYSSCCLPAAPDSSLTRPPLATCEVWIGSSCSDDADSSRLDDLDEEALTLRDGIGVVYIPLVPNEHAVPGFDPFSISTWRTEVKLEESQALLDVAEVRVFFSSSVRELMEK